MKPGVFPLLASLLGASTIAVATARANTPAAMGQRLAAFWTYVPRAVTRHAIANAHVSAVARRLAAVLICGVLMGCAASQVRDEQLQLAVARSCCASFQELPAPVTNYRDQTLSLSPDSPHFDFGDGLAPFVRLPIRAADSIMLAIYSHADNSAWLTGAYGTFKYVALQAIFLDVDGHEIARSALSAPATSTLGGGWLKLKRTVDVPPATASVILAGNLREMGQDGGAEYRRSESAMMVGGAYVASGGGSDDLDYLLSVYGKFQVKLGFSMR